MRRTVDRIDLTAPQAHTLNETGKLEIWTRMDPQPQGCYELIRFPENDFSESPLFYMVDRTAGSTEYISWPLPFGTDGRRWVAEPYKSVSIKGKEVYLYAADYVDDEPTEYSHLHSSYFEAEAMPREASRMNCNITTSAEQKDGSWWFKTELERTK